MQEFRLAIRLKHNRPAALDDILIFPVASNRTNPNQMVDYNSPVVTPVISKSIRACSIDRQMSHDK